MCVSCAPGQDSGCGHQQLDSEGGSRDDWTGHGAAGTYVLVWCEVVSEG